MSEKTGNQHSNNLKTILISLFMMLLTICLSGELLVRYMVRNDGEVRQLNDIGIPPIRLPLQEIQESIDNYKAQIDHASFIYDAELGWNNQPLYSEDGIIINADAIRANQEYDETPDDDVLRIALFGDSFTYSPGVNNDETLDRYIESALQEMGIRSEVINFGVPAYGIDQSYLRWIEDGIRYQPDIAILSISSRMSGRSLSIFRVISSPFTQFPFSKPRFYLDDDTLQLVNSPTIPLDGVIETLESFETNPLSEYEYYYDDRYKDTWWRQSLFLAYTVENIRNTLVTYLGDDPTEVNELNRAIIQAFADDVEDANAVFMLGHLPTQKNLSNAEGNFNYEVMLSPFGEHYTYLNAAQVLPVVQESDGWLEDGHYNGIGNQIVGEYFASQIVDCLNNETCMPPRFSDNPSYQETKTDS